MTKTEQGFSVIEGLLVVVVVGVIAGVGYGTLHHKRSVASVNTDTKSNSQASTLPQTAATNQPIVATGTSQSIDDLTTQDASSESSIDSKHSTNDQSTAQNDTNAASDVEGAYNESTF